jgi:nucleoside phosphorylase
MPLVHVFAAMKAEARPVQQMLARGADPAANSLKSEGPIGTNRIALFVTGMGPRRARECADVAFEISSPRDKESRARPDATIVIGTCGSLGPSSAENTLVTYTSCLSADSTQTPRACATEVCECFAQLLDSNGVTYQRIVGVTSPRVATRLEERLALAKSGALAIDMESYEIIAAANRAGVPAAVLRVVSDSLDRKMPDFDRALKADGDFDGLKALGIAAASPLRTVRMIAASRRAIRHLQKALEIILPADCF